ncbi:MAG: hypothetical protein PVF73_01775 [Bacteroidales bacterium]|jgi:hypothetical protein
MKFNILLILFILSGIISCDKEEFSGRQAETFIKYYGGDKPYAGSQVMAVSGGGYIVLGNIENTGRSMDICLIRTDMYGNSIGPVLVYGGLFDDFGYAIKKNDAGYVIAGSTKQSSLGDKEVYLIQINEAGDTLWTSVFGGDYDDEAYDVLILDNGKIVLTGYSEVSDNDANLLVAKTNALGVPEWQKNDYGFDNNEFGNSIIEAGDYFIIGGSTNSRPVGYTTYNGYLLQVTREGTNPSPISFGTEGDSEITSVVNAGNNTYYAVCNIESLQRDESEIRIIKFRHDNRDRIEIIWSEYYGEQLFNRIYGSKAGDNSLLLVGTAGSGSETGDLLLMKLDPEGNDPEYFYTGDGSSFVGTGIDFTSDNGYILSGTNFATENSVITLAKLNAEGRL